MQKAAEKPISQQYDPPPYGRADYTWPTQARATKLTFDDTYMHIHLQDERIVFVPLKWIPSLANAKPEDREKYGIGWDGQLIYWDPDDGPINEDLWVASFMRYDEPKR